MSKENSNKKEKKQISDKRNINLKWYSIGSIVLLIAIILVFNILFDSIFGKKLQFDFSATGQNSISSVTEEYLKSLPADANIRIVGLFDEPTNLRDTPFEYIVPLLENYEAKSNGKVSVQYINPETYPSIISELDPQGAYDLKADTYVVACNGKAISVDPYNCFTYDPDAYSYGYLIPTGNVAESTFTNAIVNLTRGNIFKAYFVTGLQESTHVQFSKVLDALGVASYDLPAQDGFTVPEDCDLLIISGITTDISEEMAVAMIQYLNNGGKMIVAVDDDPSMPNNINEQFVHLNDVLHEMNLHVDPYIILENDPNYQLNNLAYNSLINIDPAYSTYTSASALRCSYARPVREYDNPYSYIQVSPLLYTSDHATSNVINEQGYATQYANEGKYYVGYYSTFDGMAVPPEMYLFGCMNFTSDKYISQYGYNDANVQFVRSVVRNMLSADDSLIVPAKALSNYEIDANKATGKTVSTMMFILLIAVPIVFVIAGTIVYNKRKNL